MKVFVLYSTINGPFGGANQFMRALKQFFHDQGLLTKNIFKADIILLNSHSLGGTHGKIYQIAYLLRAMFPSKAFIHRMDGPFQLYGNKDRDVDDNNTYRLNHVVADGTIFQSGWSLERNKDLGMLSAPYETVIHNAADANFFYPAEHKKRSQKIRLIATSWSNHPNKGFDVYDELDRHLDWSRFTMTFVGRTPRTFRNIKVYGPVSSAELGSLLREQDIYITASKNDACSNSLLEALASGLPAVALASGGHPELIEKGGVLYNAKEDAIRAIEKVADNLDHYRALITTQSMGQVGMKYVDFFERILTDIQKKRYVPKRMPISLLVRRLFFRSR